MITRRQFVKVGAIGVAGLGLFRPGAPAVAAPARGGTLTVALIADPRSLDPHLTGNLQGRATVRAIHDSLLAVDEGGNLAPMLVERWEQPDPRTYLLHLRPGVKFHDGTDFDAEAVIYNFKRIQNPDISSIRAGEIKVLESMEAVDSLTVKLTLQYPFAAFLYALTDVVGCIGSPAAFEKYGKEQSGLNPVGAGPFRFVHYAQDTETVLERNPDYWDSERPYLDRIILRPIPSDSTRLTELKTGGVDIAEELPLQNIAGLRNETNFAVSERIGFRWEYFSFNARSEYPGSNKKLRQAFQWAIDREALHRAAYFGTGSVGYSAILPGNPFYDADYAPFSFDQDKAKRLLDESGLGSVEITTYLRPEAVKQRAAQIFQSMAADVGVKVNLEQVDYANHRNKLFGGTLPLDLHGWWGYRPDPDQYLSILLQSEGSYAKAFACASPEMDALFLQQRGELDPGKRKQVFDQITAGVSDDSIYIPWHYSSDFKGIGKRVQGFVHKPDSIIDFTRISVTA
ncbi:ABC transporter substrate-binding protein [Aquamicrobium ahrensii]|uniref:Peptide/nickel transport system substrate-binding protein n=1 Tax=Aquamicrobium ahrensii TaxID=469551 RepID=A0ABV2KQ12_9HYPH